MSRKKKDTQSQIVVGDEVMYSSPTGYFRAPVLEIHTETISTFNPLGPSRIDYRYQYKIRTPLGNERWANSWEVSKIES